MLPVFLGAAIFALLAIPSCSPDDDDLVVCEDGAPFTFSWEMPATLPYDLWVFLSTADGTVKAAVQAEAGQLLSLEVEQCGQERIDLNVLKVIDLDSQFFYTSDTYTHLENGLVIEQPSFPPLLSTELVIDGISSLEQVDWPNWLAPAPGIEYDAGGQQLRLSGLAYSGQPFFAHIRANGESDGRYFYADRNTEGVQSFTADYSDLSPATVKHTLVMGGLIDPRIFIAGVPEAGSDRFVPLLHTIDSTSIGLIDVYWPDEVDFPQFIFYYDEYLERYRREKRVDELPAGVDPWSFESFVVFGYPESFQIESSIPDADLLRFEVTVDLPGGSSERIRRQLVVPASRQGLFYSFPPFPTEILAEYPALADFDFEIGLANDKRTVEMFEDLDDYSIIISNYLAPKPFWRAGYQFEQRTN
jgi:hypothetical protein